MNEKEGDLLPRNDTHRRIIHLDMDAFYASVETRDNPRLAKKALIVGRDPRETNGHGVVTTANYVARKYGVHSAMPTMKALRLIPRDQIVFVTPNFPKYRAVSAEIHQLMHEITDQVQSISLDEAYLDVTENKLGIKSALQLAVRLQTKIRQEIGLNSSFGVTYNKFLAKMGSEYSKPFGRTIILPSEAKGFLAKQEIAQFHGIGPKTQEKLHKMGIYTGGDLQKTPVRTLLKQFNKMGYLMAEHANGIDLSRVVADDERNRKSIGIERTYEPSIFSEQTALTNMRNYCARLEEEMRERGFYANTVVIKVRNLDFVTVTKRRKLSQATNDKNELYASAKDLFVTISSGYLNEGIRLLGVTVTDFSRTDYAQIDLFSGN
ncbi:DNA polymerase IV [Lactobacillus sp. ESL0791]|uniref:DNA polymerase IV n=1 Tax=Lactobacillus sp. ESL0791 TaxID=2983234 RepID=UPI0023F9BDC8|nr:DNA polymerase IV [Lactobacillus sp. ESL0791]MDF7638449.1 DNA polymerase IV [Lactobacillus sp. ESL0791]